MSAVEVDERTAIAQLKRGEIRGLDALMRIYQVRAVRAAYVVTHDLALAEDIVQSAFIRAYERIEQFDESRPFGPWFLRGVVNSAATAAGQRRRFVPLTPARDAEDAVAAHADANAVVGAEPDPETLILQAETHAELWQALDQLPPAQRAAAVLRLYLELPEAEAAARLGVPTGTVKSRLNAARTRLRLVLGRSPTAHAVSRPALTSTSTPSAAEAHQPEREARR
jgi:RNA polymerase sigma-70 factor (ECF subfamily)